MTPSPSPARLLAAVLGGALGAAALVAVGAPVPARFGVLLAFAGTAALCLCRARSSPAERATWGRFALGAGLLGTNALYRMVQLSLDLTGAWSVVPAVLATAALPALYSGLVRWNRGPRLVQRRHEALTGAAAAALVLAALEAWSAHGGPLAGLPLRARLVLELPAAVSAVLLLAAVLTPLSAGVRRDARTWLATVAVVVVVVPVWARALGLSDSTWAPLPMAVAAVLLAVAAARPARTAPAGRRDGALGTGEALVLLLGAVAVLAAAATRVSPLVAALTVTTAVVCAARLVGDLRGLTQLAEVRQQASTDELTGAANRRELMRRIGEVTGRGDQVCLAVLDIDDFGTVNDGLGTSGGDRLLVEVAGRLQGVLRRTCVLGRLGGDDFAVVASAPAGQAPTDPLELGTRLTAAFAEPFTLAGLRLHVTASVGLATTTTDGEQLFLRAEAALRESKRLRAGPVLHDPARHDDTSGQLRLVGQLRQALDRDELVLHVQPQVDVRTGSTVGVEALVRWQHPDRGLLGPAAFVPLAEAHGLIGPLTERVVGLAIAQLADWRAAGVRLRMSVNLSASNLLDEALPERVLARLAEHDVDPADLTLEVTENVFAGDSARVRGVLEELAALGVDLSIDDYGTGWSSVGYLRRLPVGELKLDRSFTADLLTDVRTSAIVGSTIELAHRLGMRVVAEGVEDEATFDELHRLGCDLSQGFWHARPLPAADLPGWLAATGAGAVTAGAPVALPAG